MSDQIPVVPGGPHLRTIAMPRDTNASGTIFGDWTVPQMDLARGTFVARRAHGHVVTVSIDTLPGAGLSRRRGQLLLYAA